MNITGSCQGSDDSLILFYRSMEGIRLDEELVLKTSSTCNRCLGFESLTFLYNDIKELLRQSYILTL